MGGPSYEGAVGGFILVDPSSGTLRQKLYATTEQFPAILHQFLTDIESEHFVCKEMYVDTHSVNLSKEAEDVAAMFQTRIVPTSAGTPQELAFAESGVRNLGKLSRSMMLKMLLTYLDGAGDLQINMQRASTMFCHKNQKEINHHLKCELARNRTSKTYTSKCGELHVHMHLWEEQNTKEVS